MKLLHEEVYKDYTIKIEGKYIKDYYDYYEKETDAVKLEYRVLTPERNQLIIDYDFQYEYVAKKKPIRILFWAIKPRQTFREQVEDGIEDIVYFCKKRIDKKLFELEMTEGLMDSLSKFN
ncbi:hypothetical protein [Bacillus infantis]|uniref:hypothetical protein n=1 Tax=Bacillus infantis TaxID=324767 RepID=UPI00209FFAEF|nr:hypothetical protein [Bacillus infantis]MCP1159300.1 hypothetical protein [Bacillus infantis]